MNSTPQIIVALLALGMALAFSLADRNSPTSRWLSLFLMVVSVTIAVSSQIELPLRDAGRYPSWGGIFALPEVLAFLFAYEWILRVRRTIPTRELRTKFGDRQLRVAQALAIVYFLLAVMFPRVRIEQFIGAAGNEGALGFGFMLFAVPLLISLILGIGAGLITLNRRPDIAERQRLVAFSVASPFMASGLVLPIEWAPILTALGLVIFLVGGVQYHVIQGRRAQFLSRFLAPQVAELVRESGLKSATRHQTLEISVVCCDLRGFTAFSAATDSKQVIQILREYYDMVGTAVANVGGTIKDQAGDGVLVLIGAPIWTDDHAKRAIELARQIREGGIALSAQWSTPELRLGVGVGAASGFVTVGVIGAASRLEYTAVGPAVNLASRLCSEALHGEVLVDERSRELLGSTDASAGLRTRKPLSLKGFAGPVPNFSLETV
jgi:adenylate cyclase